MSERWSLKEACQTVDEIFPRGKGRYRRIDERELVPGLLFQFRMMDQESSEVRLMQLFHGLGGFAGELWEQHARALVRLSSSGHRGLPVVTEARHVPEWQCAYIITSEAEYTMAEEGAMGYMREHPADALRQVLLLADALFELHSRKMMHRNLWPGSIEVVQDKDKPQKEQIELRLARFEMSTLLANLLRRVAMDRKPKQDGGREMYITQGPSSLVCCPPERLAFIYPNVPGVKDTMENGNSDVYSLGVIAYQWFVESLDPHELAWIFQANGYQKEQHSALKAKMQKAISNSSLHPVLADVLRGMLEDNRRQRPTAEEVCNDLANHYEDILLAWQRGGRVPWLADDGKNPRYLVSTAAFEFRRTLYKWNFIESDPDTDIGWQELKAFIVDDLRDGYLGYSPDGYKPYQSSGGDDEDLAKAKYVLVGKRADYFASVYEKDRSPFGSNRGTSTVHEALHIKYVRQRDWGKVRYFNRRNPLNQKLPPIEVVKMKAAQLSDPKELATRQSWKPLMDAVKISGGPQKWQVDFEHALDWLLEAQAVMLEARQYRYIRRDNLGSKKDNSYVTLVYDEDSEKDRIHRNSLLHAYVGKFRRLSFGDFFDALEDAAEVELSMVQEKKPNGEQKSSSEQEQKVTRGAFVVERLDERTIVIDTRHGDIPERGLIRPAADAGSQRLLKRQRDAKEELISNRRLLDQLHRPRALIRFQTEAAEAGKGLFGNAPKIVEDMLSCWPLYALLGPPGAGKTTVATRAIIAALAEDQSKRILVTAQSHDSLDNIAERILEELQRRRIEAIAWRVASGETEFRVSPTLQAHLPTQQVEQRVANIKDACDKKLNDRQTPLEPRYREIIAEWRAHVEASGLEITDRLHRGANLVFATCGSAIAENVEEIGTDSLFDWVIVEEAAKAWPTELAIPLVRGDQWTLIGDPNQLGAFGRQEMQQLLEACAESDDPKLQEHADRKETYERVFNLFGSFFSKENKAAAAKDAAAGMEWLRYPCGELDTQFRMRKNIADVVSESFYGGSLQTYAGTAVDHHFRAPEFLVGKSLLWLDTRGLSDSNEMPRWKNLGEVRIIEKLMNSLSPQVRRVDNVAEAHPEFRAILGELAILTPYRHQLHELRKKLIGHSLRIQTIDSFQGKEADVVIVSLVRDNFRDRASEMARIGYLAELARINVLLSRAKRLLIIVGNYQHFAQTEGKWPQVCRLVRTHGHVLDAASLLDKGDNRP